MVRKENTNKNSLSPLDPGETSKEILGLKRLHERRGKMPMPVCLLNAILKPECQQASAIQMTRSI